MTTGPLRGLFVTGTDTGVGKTTISAALLRHARRRGLTPIPFKPVETGCDGAPADATLLWNAAQPPTPMSEACLYALRLPAAPSLAAAAEGIRVDLDLVVGRARALAARGDFLLVEGAGGLLVPYVDRLTTVELVRRLGLPLLVVARTALGTLNHTALTLREAERSGLQVAGVIFNRIAERIEPHESGNAQLIGDLAGCRPLGPFPFLAPAARTDADLLADALVSAVSHTALEGLLAGQSVMR
ncbi:MAG TPA: dethiobiotin synthase [Polyangia bacterium]|nr:dethiobiotin synthase [Polyangia bacterium]